MGKSNLYDRDFYCWTVENAALLREGKLAAADLLHIAEEIEDIGKRDYREVVSRLRVLLAHLLKWQFQPALRSKSWKDSIGSQRPELLEIFEQSPSLQRRAAEELAAIYAKAVRQASRETELPASAFPQSCPYSLEQVLDEDFFPEM